MRIVVFGAGSLGSLVGGLLSTVADVTLVGRAPHVEAVREHGLRITGAVDRTVHPDARTTLPGSADLAIVTVKSYDTDGAASQLADRDLDAVLSLQNGLGNEDVLADHLPCEVLAGTCTYGARFRDPGHVECTGLGTVELGPREGGESARADRVGELFDDAGFETTVATDMPRRLWRKLAVNAGINPTTALARVPNGELVDGPAGETARLAAREVGRVATDNGVELAPDDAVRAMVDVAARTAANRSSMLQDVEANRRTEIDAISGAVVDRAVEPAPVNRVLTSLVRAWERERSHR
ncbi:MAG: ketopantoate reductase family protein [Halobacteriales archaeon]